MKQVDEKILEALGRLQDDPDFMVIRTWFLESAGEQDRLLRNGEGNALYRAQGASRELLEFCNLAASPHEQLGKLAQAKAGVHPFPQK